MKKVKIIPARASWEVLPQRFSVLMSLHVFTPLPLMWFCLLCVNKALLTCLDLWKKTVTASCQHWMKIWDQFCYGHNSYVCNIKFGRKAVIIYCCLKTAYPPFEAQLLISQSASASSCVTLLPVFFLPFNFCLIPCSLICRREGKLHLLQPR